jgi:PAS domain S-box-containing protein
MIPTTPGGPALPPSPQALARLVDLAEDAILSVDEDQRIVLFNRGAERTFGYVADEVIGRPLVVLIPARFHGVHHQHLRAFAAGPVDARVMGERRPVRGRRKDGTEFPADVTISKFRDGGRLFLNAILRDVTERVRAEEAIRSLNQELEDRVKARTAELEEANRKLEHALAELRAQTDELRVTTQQLWQAAKLASVGELAASVAHELNNPLGTISLRLESVLARTPPEDPRRPALAVVEQEVERMARLIGNLLQFSRRTADRVSTVHLPDEVTRTAELAEPHLRRRGATVVFDFAADLPPILADRQKLRQLFLNLYTNAADAMPQGGRLTTRLSAETAPGGRAALVVEVTDTGVGIPADLLPRVMDPFFTTKDEGKGTGLGLAICRRIVHDHQGTIHIASEVGQGTTVRITLPVVSDGAGASGPQEWSRAPERPTP